MLSSVYLCNTIYTVDVSDIMSELSVHHILHNNLVELIKLIIACFELKVLPIVHFSTEENAHNVSCLNVF